MTDPRQTEREQQARLLIYNLTQRDTNWDCCLGDTGAVQIIMDALKPTEAAVLEEAAKDCRDQARVYDGRELMKRNILEMMADFFEAKARERRA